MKTFKSLGLVMLSLFLTTTVLAQSTLKSERIKVAGLCSHCERRIEESALKSGVTKADWNVKTKMLSITYDAAKVKVETIQKNIAAAGHDTPKFKASQKAYDALPSCCKYK